MKFKDFLNPQSMLTPTIAGTLVMVIANTLWISFAISKSWSSLILSFLLAILILIKFDACMLEKIIYYILNALIIFSMAVNTNFVGREIATKANKDEISFMQKYSITSQEKISDTISKTGATGQLSADGLSIVNGQLVASGSKSQNLPSIEKRKFFDPYFDLRRT